MKQYKSRDKITQKMTRDGLIEVNETQQTAERISKREQDADFQKSPEQQAAQDGTQLQGVASQTSPLPHAPGASPARDTATAERVMEHIEAAQTRRASKKAVHKAQEEVTVQTTSSRLQFTEEELAVPELECYIEKSNKAADRLDAAKAAIPKQKKLVKERTFDEAAGKAKTRLHFEEQEKPIPGGKKGNPLSRPAQEAGIFVHNKIHSVEKDNSGVEGAHKSEELAERGAKYGARKLKQGYRSHKLKPYREAAKAEKAAFKANVNFQYHKTLHDNPQLTSNPLSRFMQKQQIKRQYAKAAKKGGAKAAAEATRKTAKKTAEETRKAAAFAARHPAGILIAVAALLLFIMISAGLSSCGAMFSGLTNGVLGTSYTSEDSDLVAVENNYAALENGLQSEIDNIESTHPGYDEYRYDLDSIGHNPHELASYLTALLQSYTPQSAQAELERIFSMQYTLTLTEEVEIRYRTETSTDPETGETTTEEVPYEYYILNVKLTNKLISELAEELLTPQQLEMFHVYLETSGNKPLIFGGGSPDGSPSEDLSGMEFVNGTRPGNQELMELAKQQVGNVGGYPYWSWYGFNSRVEWCACFVSWCYNRLVDIDSNRYLAGPDSARSKVLAAIRWDTVTLASPATGELLAEYPRQYGRSRNVEDPALVLPRLAVKPRAWRESSIRPDVPDDIRAWLDSMDEKTLRESLKAIGDACRAAGFDPAMQACGEILRSNRDMGLHADSLTPIALRMRDGEWELFVFN